MKYARHPTLKELIYAIYGHDARCRVKKCSPPEMYKLIPAGKSWFDQEPGQGIPIGNLTSQFGANVYLTALDHFVQRILKPAAYLRYMDDLTLLDCDRERLAKMALPIDAWLQANRKQALNPSKTKLSCLTDGEGVCYLGQELRQTDVPAQPLQAFPEPLKKWKLIQSLRKFEQGPVPFPERPHVLAPLLPTHDTEHDIASVNSRMGALVHSETYRFRAKTLQAFLARTREHKGIPLELADDWSPFDVKRGYRAIKLR